MKKNNFLLILNIEFIQGMNPDISLLGTIFYLFEIFYLL